MSESQVDLNDAQRHFFSYWKLPTVKFARFSRSQLDVPLFHYFNVLGLIYAN